MNKCIFGILYLAFVSIFSKCYCQNLVPNSSFENHSGVPCGFISVKSVSSQGQTVLVPDNISNYLNNWYSPTSGTTDYWYFSGTPQRFRNGNDCAVGASIKNDIPTSAHEGFGYIGMYLTYNRSKDEYREYAQVKLIHPLEEKSIYRISFYVQISENSDYCTPNIGALLTENPIKGSQISDRLGEPLLFNPQVKNNVFLCQSGKWIKVSQCIKVNGGEEYLTIGNFFNDANTPLQRTEYTGGTNLCYYLIDDVSVEKVGGENYLPPLGFLGPDTTLCHTQKLSVIIPFKEGLVNWLGYTDTSRSISINKSGEYIATITVGGCEITDTLRVSIVPNLILPADTILCQINTPFKLSIPAGVGKLHWDDGTDDSIREITQTGLYWLTAIEKQCVQTDSIKVQIVNCPDEVPNVITPNGDGKNDTFFVKNIDIIPWELTIYDRWGSLIYQVSHYNNDWAPVGNAPGFYYYLLRENRTKKTFKGWIQVLR